MSLMSAIPQMKHCVTRAHKKDKYWVIRKLVKADTLEEALKKEKKARVLEVKLCVPEKDQLVDAIGFDADMRVYEDEDE